MARTSKSTQRSDFRLAKAGSTPAGIRRMAAAIKRRDKDAARSSRAINRELDALRSEYHARLSELIGREGVRGLDAIGSARLSRAQKERRAFLILKERGVDGLRISQLRRTFLKQALAVMGRPLPAIRIPHDDACAANPVTTYGPPYGGWYWSFYWERTSNFRDPVIDRYLDTSNGRLGSIIETRILESGDDDRVYVEYRTGFTLQHTPQIDGVLDVKLTFAFPNTAMSGQVRDEWYSSEAMHQQYVRAQLRVTDIQSPSLSEAMEYGIGGIAGYSDGDSDSWPPQPIVSSAETRTYELTTGTIFRQGSPVTIEAGITHVTLFNTDDMHGSTDADIDMRLTSIAVRSCQNIIL